MSLLVAEQVQLPSRTTSKVTVSIIVPVHNEGPAFLEFFERLQCFVGSQEDGCCEVILVDDASTDRIVDAMDSRPWLRILRLQRRGGSGAARKHGFYSARGACVAWIDGDGTYDPRSLAPLLEKLETADQVIGARKTDHGRLKWLRFATKRISFLMASLLWQRWIPDLNSGLRVCRRQAMQSWVDQLPNGFSCASTATLAALNLEQRVEFVPVCYRARKEGARSKFHPVWDTLRFWRTILRMRYRGWRQPKL